VAASGRDTRGRALTAWSLVALVAALGLGGIGHLQGGEGFRAVAGFLGPLGALWLNALQMTVVPVVVTHLLAAMVGDRGPGQLGALGARAILLFIALLVAGGLFALAVGGPAVGLYSVDAASIDAMRSATTVPEAAMAASAGAAGSVGDWIAGLLPTNLFDAALRGDILPLLIFAALLGAAVGRLPAPRREGLATLFQGSAEAMLTLIRWILWGTPVGVFALTYGVTLSTGLEVAGMLGAFVVLQSVPMLLFAGLLYPVAAVLGRTTLRAFARAVAPAQLVAVSTRSSLAALPALIAGGQRHLDLSGTATGFLLPLSVSTFKVNRTISATVKLLFLAHVFGTPLGSAQLVTFLLTVIIMSFSTVGLPGGGVAFKTMPAYLAAGVPIEGVVILEAVDTIPDIFKTLVNVTGDMTAATLLTRASRVAPRLATAAPGTAGSGGAGG
jgi:Na+/H+-dicarboxylate symporter